MPTGLSPSRIAALGLALLALIPSARGATNTLPSAAAGAPGSSSTRGLIVRSAQAPADAGVANNSIRAIKQLNGTLLNTSGGTITNEAGAGPNPGGSYYVDTINFEKDAAPFDATDPDGNVVASFSPSLFPGIPGTGLHTDNFAVEVVAYVELTAGIHTFGVNVGTDRTDVNNDDSYQVFCGVNARDFFAARVGEFERFAPPFVANTHNENLFSVDAPVAGIYPFRLVYWQTGLGANLQWYSVNPFTQERILVNDPADTRAIRAYRDSNVAQANSPSIGEVSPLPGSAGSSAAAPIEIVLFDGQTTVNTNSIQLFLNGTAVTPQTKVKAGNRTAIKYDPNASRTDPNNAIRLVFADSASASYTNTWQFTINVTGGSATTVTGQWDFENGDLRATTGQALEYFDGPAGQTATKTKFGTTGSGDFASVPNIGGTAAKVMYVPGDVIREIGYVMHHGIAPNGGGTRVNQYTLILDVLVGATGPGAASILQISSLNNTDDGDLFWQGNNFGQGTGGYNGTGAFTPGEWHRVVAAYDMSANPPVVAKFVDGIKQDDWTANQSLDNPRRALEPTAILFADGDVPNPDERREWWVSSIQIRSGKLSDAEIVLLGGPSAAGIPTQIPQTTVTGQWDFDRADLSATIGKPLRYFDGTNGVTQTGTQFGTTTELGISLINGQEARIMRVPGEVVREIGYVMDHGIAPNGGGTLVNQYTLVMDVMIAATGSGAASMLQISSLNNTDDGDLFWQGNNFGQGTGGYNGTGAFIPGEWHRVVAAYDMAASPPVVTKFVDGIKQDDWTANQSLDNPRRALQPTAILFADGDVPNPDERREWWVNSVQIRAGKLSDAEIVLLGGPSAGGIPVAVPKSNVKGQWDFNQASLAATIGKPLRYFDGTNGVTQTGTQFGTTTELGVSLINGQEARIMRVPGEVVREIGYVMDHGIAPNGGGTRVNQYTLIMDVMIATTGSGAAAMLQTSSLNNTDDGDLFWQGNNFGQGTGGYNGTGAFTAGEWHRVSAAYDMAAATPVVTKFVDGIKQDDWTANQSLDNPRRALQPTAILFADGDVPNPDERREWWVNSIQIREGKLSDAEMVALGGPTAAGIPVAITGVVLPPTIAVNRSGNTVTISWPTVATGFTLEETATLTPPSWSPVGGVVNNSVSITIGSGNRFYRLRQ
ncbi:MAG TPA: hypothetical protein VJW76_16465 [Verrucomicrobiae bacterium]|nr:hypothetical protein [Verrucomicrobiae bacterium]